MKHIDPNELEIVAAYRAPFSLEEPTVVRFPADTRVSDIIAGMPLPEDFTELYRGSVHVVSHDGQEHKLRRKYWPRIKLKGGQSVVFSYRLADGGGGDGVLKSVLSVVVAVATILTAGAAAVGFFGTAGGLFAAGTTSAKLLAAGITIAGNLLGSVLMGSSARPTQAPGGSQQGPEPASISGNLLARASALSRVIGTRWIYPSLGGQPIVIRDGPDEYAEAFFVLAGPHKLEDVRIGDSPIEDAEDVEFETREGWPDDAPMALIQRYGSNSELNQLLSDFQTEEDFQTLTNQANPALSCPKFQSSVSSKGCDEIHIHLTMPAGLYRPQDPADRQTVPIRIRLTSTTTDIVYNLPELWLCSSEAQEVRANVLLRWATAPAFSTPTPTQAGFNAAYKHAAGQVDPNPVTADWDAHANFSAGAGNDGYYNGVELTSNVRNVRLSRYNADLYLDEAQIPKDEYRIEIKHGAAIKENDLNYVNHTYNGNVADLFWYRIDGGKFKVWRSQNVTDAMYVQRVVSVFNSHPIAGGAYGPGMAIIAVRALNRNIPNLSVKASGYVPDWDGAAWANWITTSNPAPHYRYILRGDLSPWPIDEILVDNDSLVAWRTRCATDGLTCDMVCEGARVDEVLMKLAGNGMARPRMSETWGVVQDYDRSAEDPVQVFNQRNSNDLTLDKAFNLVPDAFLVTYKDADNIDTDVEILVWRPGREGTVNPRIEAIQYDGINNETNATARALFDLQQLVLRSDIWSLRVGVEGIRTTRGDLVSYNSDALDLTHGSGRLVDVEVVDDEVIAVRLDTEVTVYNEPDLEDITALEEIEHLELIGLHSHVQIRLSDSTHITEPIAGPTGRRDRLELATPIEVELDGDDGGPLIRYDCLADVGKAGNVSLRLIVTDIAYEKDHFARLTMANEAPELFEAA